MKKLGLALAMAVLFPAVAQATSANYLLQYHLKLHFGKEFFGKQVSGVWAHVGVLAQQPQGPNTNKYWDSVKHVQMKATGDHFFKTLVVQARHTMGYPRIYGPIIQYWVYFKDGSAKQITRSEMIPITQKVQPTTCGANPPLKKEGDQFLRTTKDGTKTEAALLECGWVS